MLALVPLILSSINTVLTLEWELFDIRGLIPDNPALAAVGERYYDCFRVHALDSGIDLSSQQIIDLLDQVPSTLPSQ